MLLRSRSDGSRWVRRTPKLGRGLEPGVVVARVRVVVVEPGEQREAEQAASAGRSPATERGRVRPRDARRTGRGSRPSVAVWASRVGRPRAEQAVTPGRAGARSAAAGRCGRGYGRRACRGEPHRDRPAGGLGLFSAPAENAAAASRSTLDGPAAANSPPLEKPDAYTRSGSIGSRRPRSRMIEPVKPTSSAGHGARRVAARLLVEVDLAARSKVFHFVDQVAAVEHAVAQPGREAGDEPGRVGLLRQPELLRNCSPVPGAAVEHEHDRAQRAGDGRCRGRRRRSAGMTSTSTVRQLTPVRYGMPMAPGGAGARRRARWSRRGHVGWPGRARPGSEPARRTVNSRLRRGA